MHQYRRRISKTPDAANARHPASRHARPAVLWQTRNVRRDDLLKSFDSGGLYASRCYYVRMCPLKALMKDISGMERQK
jgi:hypothetical protein